MMLSFWRFIFVVLALYIVELDCYADLVQPLGAFGGVGLGVAHQRHQRVRLRVRQVTRLREFHQEIFRRPPLAGLPFAERRALKNAKDDSDFLFISASRSF